MNRSQGQFSAGNHAFLVSTGWLTQVFYGWEGFSSVRGLYFKACSIHGEADQVSCWITKPCILLMLIVRNSPISAQKDHPSHHIVIITLKILLLYPNFADGEGR